MKTEDLPLLGAQIDALINVIEQNQPLGNDGSFNPDGVKNTTCQLIDMCFVPEKALALKNWMEVHEFWTSPASARYHCNVKGGLSAHSLMVTYQALTFALPLFENFTETKRAGLYNFTASDILIASIAHDFCKAGFYGTEMRKTKNYEGNWVYEPFYKVKPESRNLGHGNESVLNLLEIFPEYIKNRPVLEAISRHMGFSDLSENESYNYSNFLQNPLVLLLQLADQTASQWWEL